MIQYRHKSTPRNIQKCLLSIPRSHDFCLLGYIFRHVSSACVNFHTPRKAFWDANANANGQIFTQKHGGNTVLNSKILKELTHFIKVFFWQKLTKRGVNRPISSFNNCSSISSFYTCVVKRHLTFCLQQKLEEIFIVARCRILCGNVFVGIEESD